VFKFSRFYCVIVKSVIRASFKTKLIYSLMSYIAFALKSAKQCAILLNFNFGL